MKTCIAFIFIILNFQASARRIKTYDAIANKDSIAPISIIKDISDSVLGIIEAIRKPSDTGQRIKLEYTFKWLMGLILIPKVNAVITQF